MIILSSTTHSSSKRELEIQIGYVMPAGARSFTYQQNVDEYVTRINNAIPHTMSNLWRKEGYPTIVGVDSEGLQPLLLWGLDSDEPYYRGFIDSNARLWKHTKENNYLLGDMFSGVLRRFQPEDCTSLHELTIWESLLLNQ